MRVKLAIIIATIIVTASLLVSAFALYSRFEQTNQRRVQQTLVNKALAEGNQANSAAIRTVLCYFLPTDSREAQTRIVFANALHKINQPPCDKEKHA